MDLLSSHRVTHFARVVAALASFIPLAITWEALEQRLTPTQRETVRTPPVVLSMAFGTGYAASTDARATVLAIVIAAAFLSAYDDLLETTSNPFRTRDDGDSVHGDPKKSSQREL